MLWFGNMVTGCLAASSPILSCCRAEPEPPHSTRQEQGSASIGHLVSVCVERAITALQAADETAVQEDELGLCLELTGLLCRDAAGMQKIPPLPPCVSEAS